MKTKTKIGCLHLLNELSDLGAAVFSLFVVLSPDFREWIVQLTPEQAGLITGSLATIRGAIVRGLRQASGFDIVSSLTTTRGAVPELKPDESDSIPTILPERMNTEPISLERSNTPVRPQQIETITLAEFDQKGGSRRD